MSAAGATVEAIKGSIPFSEASDDISLRPRKSTSAALMMVLLSAALFLAPGMNDEVTGAWQSLDCFRIFGAEMFDCWQATRPAPTSCKF
jgi:hypothetical protein